MTVPQHDIGVAEAGVGAGQRHRGHGMAVDDEAAAEAVDGLVNQALQGGMIGFVMGFDTPDGFFKIERATIDFSAAGDDLGDRAEPGPDTG